MIYPTLNRILMFSSPEESGAFATEATAELGQVGVNLISVPVHSLTDIAGAYEANKGRIDCVWLHNDPVVVTENAFELLKTNTARDKVPLVTTLSAKFAEQGALMSISVDLPTLGSQAAAMASAFLEEHVPMTDLGVQSFLGGKLAVNMQTATQLGIQIPADARPLINILIMPTAAGRSTTDSP